MKSVSHHNVPVWFFTAAKLAEWKFPRQFQPNEDSLSWISEALYEEQVLEESLGNPTKPH